VELFRSLDEFPETFHGGAVAIGNFDGVHLGHARLVERLRTMAKRVGGPAIVFTFDPPPVRLLRPHAAPELLVWTERKVELLSQLGVDATLIYPTNEAFLHQEARQFFDEVVRQRLGMKAMVEGPNFFFGHNRSGNVETLRQFCGEAGMPFEAVQPVEIGGEYVSSSRIRALVMAGKVAEAAAMLGRPYRIRGDVIRGASRGRQIGFPTANVGEIDTLLPGQGIYAARAFAKGGWHPAAVNIGPNPTFGEGHLKVEVFIIDFTGWIYDQPIQVDFLAQLREIRRFPSVDALKDQMAHDVAKTVEIVARANFPT
jgi:riboflavin kinase/FMN adenylyltransferase